MLPFKSLIPIQKNAQPAIYIQITNGFIQQIQNGVLKAGDSLPGSRKLADLLTVNRQTVVKAMEELEAQGWIELRAQRGTFISEKLPEIHPLRIGASLSNMKKKAPSQLIDRPFLTEPVVYKHQLGFDDGVPDVRLAPLNELATEWSSNFKSGKKSILGYTDARGEYKLRHILSKEFGKTRGITCDADNILITRGAQSAFFIIANGLLRPGDAVVVGELNYFTSNLLFEYFQSDLLKIPVDEQGIQVDALEDLCKKRKIRLVYVTSHHHHPTTVTLAPERRIQLLALSEKYNFTIIEDDYDYDFHFNYSPILPLASADRSGRVIYIGSFTKSIAPAVRVGYIVARGDYVTEFMKIRRLVDRLGDPMLERAVASIIENGTFRRYLKKAVKLYQERRDLCATCLKEIFKERIQFKKPEGGLAIWCEFDESLDLPQISHKAKIQQVHFPDGKYYQSKEEWVNGARIGFASMNIKEHEKTYDILRKLVD